MMLGFNTIRMAFRPVPDWLDFFYFHRVGDADGEAIPIDYGTLDIRKPRLILGGRVVVKPDAIGGTLRMIRRREAGQ